MKSNRLRVCLIEEDSTLREGLAFLINWMEGCQVVGTYANYCQALPQLSVIKPQLVVMDLVCSPGMSRINGILKIKRFHPQVEILVWSAHEENALVFGALQAGATGYLTKNTSLPRMIAAIGEVQAGGAPLSNAIARRVIGSFHKNSLTPLSKREMEVLQLLARGQSYRMIADALFVDGETIRTHLKNIYAKLGVHSKADALEKARKERLIQTLIR